VGRDHAGDDAPAKHHVLIREGQEA
jgi:hypothetical protein